MQKSPTNEAFYNWGAREDFGPLSRGQCRRGDSALTGARASQSPDYSLHLGFSPPSDFGESNPNTRLEPFTRAPFEGSVTLIPYAIIIKKSRDINIYLDQ